MDLNFDKLTLGETAKVEELAGVSIANFGSPEASQVKILAAMVYVMKKREDRNFKWEDALDFTVEDAVKYLGVNDEDPKDEN